MLCQLQTSGCGQFECHRKQECNSNVVCVKQNATSMGVGVVESDIASTLNLKGHHNSNRCLWCSNRHSFAFRHTHTHLNSRSITVRHTQQTRMDLMWCDVIIMLRWLMITICCCCCCYCFFLIIMIIIIISQNTLLAMAHDANKWDTSHQNCMLNRLLDCISGWPFKW